jgi:hypothetical protein
MTVEDYLQHVTTHQPGNGVRNNTKEQQELFHPESQGSRRAHQSHHFSGKRQLKQGAQKGLEKA